MPTQWSQFSDGVLENSIQEVHSRVSCQDLDLHGLGLQDANTGAYRDGNTSVMVF